jgi:hypothetical protein
MARDPWLQRPDESGPAFEAFKAYLDLGPSRSVVEAFRQRTGKEQAKQASGQWNDWAARFDWSDRTRAWDDRQEAIRRRAEEKAAAERAEIWAKRRGVLDERTWTAAELLARRAQDLATFPVSRKTVHDGGKVTTIEPLDGTGLRAAASVHKTADTLARKTLESQAAAPVAGSETLARFEADLVKVFGDGGTGPGP